MIFISNSLDITVKFFMYIFYCQRKINTERYFFVEDDLHEKIKMEKIFDNRQRLRLFEL